MESLGRGSDGERGVKTTMIWEGSTSSLPESLNPHHESAQALLGGSWVVMSRYSRVSILITHIRGLITHL